MNPNNAKQSSAVVAAVRDKYERLQYALKALEDEVKRTRGIYDQAVENLSASKQEIEELVAFLDAASDTEDVGTPPPPEAGEGGPSRRLNNLHILYRTRAILESVPFMRTADIYAELVRQGVVFTVANPVQRISQLLSENDWFENDRAKGWHLKNESPAATGLPSATESDSS